MRSSLYWSEFADVVIRTLMRPEPTDPLLIIADTTNDMSLTEACLAAGLRAGADTQLIIKQRHVHGSASSPGPILSDAILASRMMLVLCGGICRAPATVEATAKGTRVLASPTINEGGIEEYVIRALLDVNIESMNRNAELVAGLWNQTSVCRITSPQGTDLEFEMMPGQGSVGDGAITEDGEIDFFPGTQVNTFPLEETVNGTIVIDASDSIQGVVHNPYSFTMEKGVITSVEGDMEANAMREWLATREDDRIYKMWHVSMGMNPQAGISGNMIEDERMLTAIDFGFGDSRECPYHMDIMLATPTVYLDGKPMSGGGELNAELGFEDMSK
jgi:2,5-dihydroxypyridine 5,6-dioxygenase